MNKYQRSMRDNITPQDLSHEYKKILIIEIMIAFIEHAALFSAMH